MRGKRTLPNYGSYRGLTLRQWKSRKRRELRALEKAVWCVLYGCGQTPIHGVGVVLSEVKEWRRLCSVKEWGR